LVFSFLNDEHRMFSDFFAALSLCGMRNSYIIPVFIRNVNSFSNIFLFYSPKGF